MCIRTLSRVTGRVGKVDEYATSVVRLFSGHAQSVIWFSGPVPYEETRLEADLVADLRAWDTAWHVGLAADGAWSRPDLAVQHDRAGARLARRLADQLGDDFQVEHDLGGVRRRVRAAGPARNAEAAATFRAMAERTRTEWIQLREIVDRANRDGHTLSWRAEP